MPSSFINKTLTVSIALALLAASVAHASHGEYTKYEISVALLPEKGEFRGGAHIYIPETGAKKPRHTLYVGGVQILSATLNGKKIDPLVKDGAMEIRGEGKLNLLFGARFGDGARAEGPDNSGVVRGNSITNTSAFLQSGWYPRLSGPGLYSLSVFVPTGLVAVSEADVAGHEDVNGGRRYDFDLFEPTDSITLVVDRYEVIEKQAGLVSVEAYFFREDRELAKKYLDRAAGYIRMYEEIIGPFPYRRFAVVEGALPTGYSMPTFTLIGRSVAKLPFILDTSLGHEVLHQWYGNSVRIAEGGNWAEGLTAYMADYLYDEKKGAGADHRKRLLTDYQSYVKPGSELALREFMSRTDLATRAVGYAKGAMVFHMLRGEVGDDVFRGGLRRFYEENRNSEAGWDDLRKAFEAVSGQDLDWFFRQWVETRGALGLSISAAYPLVLGGKDKVYIEVTQEGEPRRFLLPVRVVSEAGAMEHKVRMEGKRQGFELEAGGRPVAVVLDRGYDLMRRLDEPEVPPTVSMLTGAGEGTVVMPEKDRDKYEPVASAFASRGYAIVNEGGPGYSELAKKAAVIMSGAEGVFRRLYGKKPDNPAPGAGFVIDVQKNPLSLERPLAIVYVSSRQEAEAAAGKISHYGRYSRLAFKSGDNTLKETAAAEAGIRKDLGLKVVGLRVKDALTLERIIKEAGRKQVIYVGEAHTAYEHHKVQIEFIRRLHESGESIAIGMEMFQTPFQNSLDGYVKGSLDEREFLDSSGYFTRWSYNYHLYREILDYARAKGIPVVALNQRSEIVSRVSRGGIGSLSVEERAMLPQDMDLKSPAYRERLREVFGHHSPGSAFADFYTAQVIWDETMAHTIAGYLGDNPGQKMVVITGQGHTAWRSGIPERVKRITGLDYALVIQNEEGALDASKADYVLFTGHMDAPAFPVIGVKLKSSPDGLIIEELMDGGPASEAGLMKGDLLFMAGGRQLKDIGDLKILLYDRRPGDTVEVKVKRKRFLRGAGEKAFILRLK